MARQADHGVKRDRLVKIANEAFADIDRHFVQPKRGPANRLPQNPQPLPYYTVYQVVQVPGKKEINHKEAVPGKKEINHKEAAHIFGGKVY